MALAKGSISVIAVAEQAERVTHGVLHAMPSHSIAWSRLGGPSDGLNRIQELSVFQKTSITVPRLPSLLFWLSYLSAYGKHNPGSTKNPSRDFTAEAGATEANQSTPHWSLLAFYFLRHPSFGWSIGAYTLTRSRPATELLFRVYCPINSQPELPWGRAHHHETALLQVGGCALFRVLHMAQSSCGHGAMFVLDLMHLLGLPVIWGFSVSFIRPNACLFMERLSSLSILSTFAPLPACAGSRN